MLLAHAGALLPVEDWLGDGDLPPWQARGAALRADLHALGLSPPAMARLDWPRDDAAHWGTAYVLEGSRLGGAVIERQLPAHLPRAYLGQVHPPGHWRLFLAALESRAGEGGAPWRADAIMAAQRAFSAFADAARRQGSPNED